VTQAITLLLHFPAAAAAVSAGAAAGSSAQMNQPGIAVLLSTGRAARGQSRGHHGADAGALARPAGIPAAVASWPPASRWWPTRTLRGQELRQAVARLLDTELRRRLEVLIEKARAQTLDEAEKLELQALTVAQTRIGWLGPKQRRARRL
jgi:hypothetical protein